MADTENFYNDLIIINLYVLCNKRGIKAFSPKTPKGKNVRFYRKMLNHRRHFLFELPTRNDSELKYLLEILMKISIQNLNTYLLEILMKFSKIATFNHF